MVTIAGLLAAGAALAAAFLFWRLFSRISVLPPPDDLSPETVPAPEERILQELRRRAEEETRKLARAVECSSSMVVLLDTAGKLEYCNPAFSSFTGFSRRELQGRRAAILKSKEGDPAIYKELWGHLLRGEPWEGQILERKKNGEVFWSLKYFAPVRNKEGPITHFVGVSHDITSLKNSEETIRRLAYYDPLTDLPNRTLFKEILAKTLSQAKRDETSCAVVALDLDRFKNVNDSLGVGAGDQLLAAVGERLRHCLREGDTVARLSGNVFIMCLPGLKHPKEAEAAAATAKAAMNRPFQIAGQELIVTASIGISLFPGDHTEIDPLIKNAEAAMHHAKTVVEKYAKELGRDQFQYYDAIPSAATVEDISLETSLRFAAERDELEVFYQPKIELESGHCLTVEALIRWRHPELGMISPGKFIPIAEETGLITSIGEWVLRRVCRQIKQWKAEGIDLTVAVNLSARQFRQKDLLERIDTILADSGVDCTRLEFEITESAIMNDPRQTAEILRGFKERRLSLSIDDFGTGYSSLSYLRLFPVDILKIDQSFVRDIGTPKGDPHIVKAIIALAHSLDLTVVAEGVETAAQLEFLRRESCDMVQGYYYSRPVPAEELAKWLRGPGNGRGNH